MSNNLPLHILSILTACLDPYLSGQDDSSTHTLWIAYSGGLDSTVLLHTAAAYAKLNSVELKAIHVNHNLSPNARLWQQHCASECQKLGIELVTKSVDLQDEGKGLEAAARKARYAAMAEEVKAEDFVLLGQHQNDQVETFFLQLLRGAGTLGLSGMAEFSVSEQGNRLIRPFLKLSRAQLHLVALEQGLTWIEDESNQDNSFDRNYLRNDVLPLLRERWGSADTAISRSMSHIQEQQQLLNDVAAKELPHILGDRQQINIEGLRQHSHAWQKQIVKIWLTQQNAQQPSEKVLEHILQDCMEARGDAQPKVSWGDWQCCRFAGELYLLPQLKDLSGTTISLKPEETVELPDGRGTYQFTRMDIGSETQLYIHPQAKLEIRFGGFTQRFKPAGAKHSKPLNQWFKQWQIPPWERTRTPLLFADGELVAVGDTLSHVDDVKTQKDNVVIKWSKVKFQL